MLSAAAAADLRSLTVVDLHDLLVEAAQTDLWLASVMPKRRIASYWPEVKQDWLAYPPERTAQPRLIASPKQLDNYELVAELLQLVEVKQRRLLWACAVSAVRRTTPAWSKLGRILGMDRRTVRRRYEDGLVQLWHAIKSR